MGKDLHRHYLYSKRKKQHIKYIYVRIAFPCSVTDPPCTGREGRTMVLEESVGRLIVRNGFSSEFRPVGPNRTRFQSSIHHEKKTIGDFDCCHRGFSRCRVMVRWMPSKGDATFGGRGRSFKLTAYSGARPARFNLFQLQPSQHPITECYPRRSVSASIVVLQDVRPEECAELSECISTQI